MLRAECGGTDDHTSHKQRASSLHPGPSPSSSTSLFTLPGDAKAPDLQRIPLASSLNGAPSPKYQCRSLFILSKAATNSRILPEGLLSPDAQVQSLGTRVGFVLETSNTTRRYEQALQLFLSLIFTRKPKTKHQVAKNSHRAI